ncbi:hypothetical protein C8R26_1672 [Nitrosomonas oligotropha]|uniref:Uncharacterized protein n=1 Tax=Nitrosomonas oligotropha TaxID=42354 RepID=A0A2T5GXS7_9PROT|nr:hypothetical protein C8R26_1672 [Nitrosomonas oligotropha]
MDLLYAWSRFVQIISTVKPTLYIPIDKLCTSYQNRYLQLSIKPLDQLRTPMTKPIENYIRPVDR